MAGTPATPSGHDVQMGRHAGEALVTITCAQSLTPLDTQAQPFLYGFNIFSIFQECNDAHKSKEDCAFFVQNFTVSEKHATDGRTTSAARVPSAALGPAVRAAAPFTVGLHISRWHLSTSACC